MQLAVRSYLAAGVAIVGVGAVAISPVTPSMPDVQVPAVYSSTVELSALVNPFQEYAIVFNQALQNAAGLAERIADNPAPILSQIVSNQLDAAAGIATFVGAFGESVVGQLVLMPGQLELALGQLAAGNVTQALNTVLNAIMAPIVQPVVDTLLFNPEVYTALQTALTQPLTNLMNVINLTSYPNVLNLLGPLLAPVQVLTDVTNAVGAAGDGVVAGIRTGDLEEIANALLSLGPDVTQAILNGNPVAQDYAAGLLGPQGIFAGLLTIRDMIAAAITPKVAVGTSSVGDPTVPGDDTEIVDVVIKDPVIKDPSGTEPEAPVKEVPVKEEVGYEKGEETSVEVGEGETSVEVGYEKETWVEVEETVVEKTVTDNDADLATEATYTKEAKEVRSSIRDSITKADDDASDTAVKSGSSTNSGESSDNSGGAERSSGSGSDSGSE